MRTLRWLVVPFLVILNSGAQAGPSVIVHEASPSITAGHPGQLDYQLRLDGIAELRAVTVRAELPRADAQAFTLSLDPPYAATRVFRASPERSASGLRFAMVFPRTVPAGPEPSDKILATLHRESLPPNVAGRPALTAQAVTRDGKQIDLPVSYAPRASFENSLPRVQQLLVTSANPGAGRTQIRYVVPQRGEVALSVFDVRGRKVKTLTAGFQERGTYSLSWDQSDDAQRTVPPGVYFLKLWSRDAATTQKLILMR